MILYGNITFHDMIRDYRRCRNYNVFKLRLTKLTKFR